MAAWAADRRRQLELSAEVGRAGASSQALDDDAHRQRMDNSETAIQMAQQLDAAQSALAAMEEEAATRQAEQARPAAALLCCSAAAVDRRLRTRCSRPQSQRPVRPRLDAMPCRTWGVCLLHMLASRAGTRAAAGGAGGRAGRRHARLRWHGRVRAGGYGGAGPEGGGCCSVSSPHSSVLAVAMSAVTQRTHQRGGQAQGGGQQHGASARRHAGRCDLWRPAPDLSTRSHAQGFFSGLPTFSSKSQPSRRTLRRCPRSSRCGGG
jgi:hypothetical protein